MVYVGTQVGIVTDLLYLYCRNKKKQELFYISGETVFTIPVGYLPT